MSMVYKIVQNHVETHANGVTQRLAVIVTFSVFQDTMEGVVKLHVRVMLDRLVILL